MKVLDMVTALLLIVAGLYVGLLAADFNLMAKVPMGDMPRKVVFALFGAAAVYQFVQWRGIRRRVKG